jgi:phosphate starvation-inducible protein PhoH and related proteins
VLKHVQGLSFVYFDEADVVRHHLVQRIIRAYDEHKTKVAEEQLDLLEAKTSANGHGAVSDQANPSPVSEPIEE